MKAVPSVPAAFAVPPKPRRTHEPDDAGTADLFDLARSVG
jgi:hypothetical protein